MERQDYLPENTPLPDDFDIDGDPLYIDNGDEDELEQKIREIAYVLRFVGGVVSIAADKHEIAPGIWVNRGFAVRWNSYAPGERLAKDDKKQEQGKGDRSGRRGKRRQEPRETREERPTQPEAEPVGDDLEPDGGTVVDRLDPDEVDPDNAGIKADHEHDPARVFAGEA